MKVVIVDDEKHARDSIIKLIDFLELNLDVVAEAENVKTAVYEIDKHNPDLVLLDINLPDIDGFEVVAHIRKIPDVESTPVIALTANAMVGDKERCLEGRRSTRHNPVLREC